MLKDLPRIPHFQFNFQIPELFQSEIKSLIHNEKMKTLMMEHEKIKK